MTLVQPDLRQPELNDATKFEEQFQRLSELSLPQAGAVTAGPRLVLWPKSGVPDYLEAGYPAGYYTRTTAAADPDFARWRIGRLAGPDGVVDDRRSQSEHRKRHARFPRPIR